MKAAKSKSKRCGYVAIVGRPNVGKSTLLNHILKQKISITSRKPQTTRHRIIGIHTTADTQFVYVDTPGLHAGIAKRINRIMNETVHSVIEDVDVILFVIERLVWGEKDQLVLDALAETKVPILLLINKCDLVAMKRKLLPHIEELATKAQFSEIIPLSALSGHNMDILDECVEKYLPQGEFLFPEDQVTDRSARFFAAELIREKVTRQLGDEIPYEVTVEIEKYQLQNNSLHIHGLILVEREGQKQIIIGKGGDRLKLIGSDARVDMERAFNNKVMLKLWVKVKRGWGDDKRVLKSLGY